MHVFTTSKGITLTVNRISIRYRYELPSSVMRRKLVLDREFICFIVVVLNVTMSARVADEHGL